LAQDKLKTFKEVFLKRECKHKSKLDESVIYSDYWKAYDGLVDYGAKAYYIVKHSKNEF